MFIDRKDGGQRLAEALEKYKDKNAIVLGIPRGGVETAYYVAKHLKADLSVLVSRKLGFPDNPEAAFGAIAEDGSLYLADIAQRYLPQETIATAIELQNQEIAKRIKLFRSGKPLPDVKNKTVILVDDGIATGATIFAAVEMCKNLKAKKIVAAAPIADEEVVAQLREKADEVVIVNIPYTYWAVSQGYQYFYDLSDEDVQQFMQRWEREKMEEANSKQ